MGDIDPMGKEIGHGAAAKVPKPAPAVELFFAKGLVGSVAEPLLPIERLDFDGVVFAPRQIVLPPIGADLGNAAEAAALNQIHGIAEMAPTALLHAALQDLFDGVAARGIDIASGDHLIIADSVGGVEEVIHAAAGADDADAERVIGAENSGRGKSGQSPSDKKSAAIQVVCHGEHLSGSGPT